MMSKHFYEFFPGFHKTSFLPLLFSTLERTNSKSDNLLIYFSASLLIFSFFDKATVCVSALRATVRALCKNDALSDPPGSINEFKAPSFLLY